MGETLTDLAAGVPGLPQRGAGVDVRLSHGALGSIDDLAFYSGGNVAAVTDGSGLWELLQFRDATLIGVDTWRLQHLLRGQQGTEGNMQVVLPAGSQFILMDAAPTQIPVATSLRGITRRYRIGPASRPVDDSSFVEITHASLATGLKPYAPVHLATAPDGAGGQNVSWIRRTRVNGDSWDLAEVPLGEAFESYRVRVLKDGAICREATVGASVWTYSASEISADAVVAPYVIEISQLSDLYGAGSPARIIVNA